MMNIIECLSFKKFKKKIIDKLKTNIFIPDIIKLIVEDIKLNVQFIHNIYLRMSKKKIF